ncbi:MAG: DUF748 domain-containing protein [Halioglobus sp.]|nr:DUF748 domain-containing protein [Halioglobus sp.]
MRWEGTLSLPSALSEGRFEVANFSLHDLWRGAEPWLDFEVVEGRLDLAATYRVNWGEPLAYELAQGRLAIREVDIAPRRTDELPDTGVGLRSLEVTGIEVDGAALEATVGGVDLDGLAVNGWSEGERISLVEMFSGPVEAGDAGGQSDPPSAQQETTADDAQWRASIGQVRIGGSTLNWRSEYTDPATLTVAPIEAEVGNLNWPLAGQAPFRLSLSVNDEADFEAQGELAMGEGGGTVAYTLAGLPLPWFNPNLPTALKASITGGVAGFEGELTLDEFAPQLIALDAQIENFSARQEGVETVFTSWDAVRAKALEVDLAGRAFKLGQLGINGYSGRLHIHEDGSINASRIWQQELAAEADAEDTPPRARRSHPETARKPPNPRTPGPSISRKSC